MMHGSISAESLPYLCVPGVVGGGEVPLDVASVVIEFREPVPSSHGGWSGERGGNN